jgi:hypothetical protein
LPRVAFVRVGAPGTVAGVAVSEFDGGPVPTAFVAVTVNVYCWPFVSPFTVQPVAPFVPQVKPPGDAVAVYPVIALPPSDEGAVHERPTWVLPRTADTSVGAPGTVAAATGVAVSVFEGDPVPTPFVAVTAKEYWTPFVRFVTVQLVVPFVEHVAPPGDAVAV